MIKHKEKSKKLLYLSHPFTTGDMKKNIKHATKCLYELTNRYKKDYVIISPIHAYGTLDGQLNYEDGLDLCIDLLSKCDAIVMAGNYFTSRGCKEELEYALRNKLEVFNYTDMVKTK